TLTAKVTDATGSPKASVTVHFAVTAGGGSVNPAAATTAADGTASTVLTLGSTAGVNTVSASADGITTPASFSVTGTAIASQSLGVGAVVNFDNGTIIVRPATSGEQYAVVAHYNTSTAAASAALDVTGNGIVAPSTTFPSL